MSVCVRLCTYAGPVHLSNNIHAVGVICHSTNAEQLRYTWTLSSAVIIAINSSVIVAYSCSTVAVVEFRFDFTDRRLILTMILDGQLSIVGYASSQLRKPAGRMANYKNGSAI